MGGDWYPLIPWFGVVLLGVEIGKYLYPLPDNRGPRPAFLDRPKKVSRLLVFLGRHSLVIYLIHQPIFIGAILIFQRLTR